MLEEREMLPDSLVRMFLRLPLFFQSCSCLGPLFGGFWGTDVCLAWGQVYLWNLTKRFLYGHLI